MTTLSLPRPFRPTPIRVASLALCLMLGGCTTVGDWFSSDKTDYRGGAKRTQPLDVPPDLTQLQRESRYLPQGGVVTASDLSRPGAAPGGAAAAPATPGAPTVALNAVGDLRIVRQGDQRWLATKESPDVVWPKVHEYWLSRGFKYTVDDQKTGVLETDWAENRAKLPGNFIRDMLGKVVDGLFDSGLRDRYRTRLERQADGSTEIFVTQYGATEELVGVRKDETQWVPRPNDPQLEAQVLSELMLALGGVPDANVATAPEQPASGPDLTAAAAVGAIGGNTGGPPRARLLAGQAGATMQVDDNFDRAWRRIGLALDHGGFTVEDRDRAQGLYYVRFTDAKEAARDEPGMFSKILGFFGKSSGNPVGKYRISVKAPADSATVTVLNDQGQPDNSENAQRIVGLLVDELK